MASCLIFHGPGAKDAALRKVTEIGHFMAPPYGEGGFDTPQARDMVAHLLESPRLPGIGCVVAGPIDEATPKAFDVILKIIEDFDGDVVLPILWAHDLGGVTATVRSRCLDIWCPGSPPPSEDDDLLMGIAWDLVTKTLDGDIASMPPVIKSLKDEHMLGLVSALSEVLASQIDQPKVLEVWERLRRVILWPNPKPIEVMLALMGSKVTL